MPDTFMHGHKILRRPTTSRDLFKNGTQGRDDRKTNLLEMSLLSIPLIHLH